MSRSLATLIACTLALGACASTGATFGSGVGDAMLSRAPWYAGVRTTPVATPGVRAGAAPIAYQKQDLHGEVFDPSGAPGSPIAQLLGEMNAYLDSLTAANGTVPVRMLEATAAGARPAMRGTPPDVRFGCLRDGNLPANDCTVRGESVLGRDANQNQMRLEVGRPSADWVTWFGEETANSGVEHALVLTLEIGEYHVRQRGIRGHKYIELGSNHRLDLPWLTSLEQPVPVLQLTGALVGRDGKALRIGAEGLFAKRTGIIASGVGLTALIADDDVAALRTLRRADLPGQPLVWQVALRTLVQQLTR